MAAVSKAYGVGDTVFVYYRNHATLRFAAQSRVVRKVSVDSAGNSALVEFNEGESVTDVAADQRVFTTAALCSTKITSDVISEYQAAAAADATLSGASTASQPTTGLIRKS